jgi:tRNA G10  N-methylase Trm11
MTFWFILGREPFLSSAELFARLNLLPAEASPLGQSILRVEKSVVPNELINSLGGTVKIAEEVATGINPNTLSDVILEQLRKQVGKITFGCSWYGATNEETNLLEKFGKELKKILKAEGRSVRYIYKNEAVLSSVTVEKNKLLTAGQEFIIVRTGQTVSLAITKVVQPFEALSARDYGRPGRDSTSGMLPPKLALMLVNLTQCPKNQPLLDPFCGSGTILTEAMLCGYTALFGTDLSAQAVEDCQKNLSWITERFRIIDVTPAVVIADVTKLSETLKTSIAAIATEPYMGPPQTGRETVEELRKSANELEQLYIKAFEQFKKILAPDGTVVFVIPRFERVLKSTMISDTLIGKLQTIGFIVDPLLPASIRREPFLLYRRENQLVAREIWRFKLKKP